MSTDRSASWGCVIVAAGKGTRFAGTVPKQFTGLAGKPVVEWSLGTFLGMEAIREIVVVVPPGEDGKAWAPVADPRLKVAEGGRRRQDSVLAGLRSMGRGITHVLVHDAARPLVGDATVSRVMEAAVRSGAAAPVLPVRDTLKRSDGGLLRGTVSRDGLLAVQTPQGFLLDALLASLEAADADLPDECSALEAAGIPVSAVAGDPFAAKLTDSSDLPFLEALAGATRTGTGLDFHPFCEDRPLRVCGLELGCSGGLLGHSDGDVALHAVADSLLSASRLGDIGTLFPSDDPALAGADSSELLAEAASRVAGAGWDVMQVDLTIVGESPRVSVLRDRMISRLSEILRIPSDRIWVKGTTTNTLGDIGRGRGLAAVSVAVLRRRSMC